MTELMGDYSEDSGIAKTCVDRREELRRIHQLGLPGVGDQCGIGRSGVAKQGNAGAVCGANAFLRRIHPAGDLHGVAAGTLIG